MGRQTLKKEGSQWWWAKGIRYRDDPLETGQTRQRSGGGWRGKRATGGKDKAKRRKKKEYRGTEAAGRKVLPDTKPKEVKTTIKTKAERLQEKEGKKKNALEKGMCKQGVFKHKVSGASEKVEVAERSAARLQDEIERKKQYRPVLSPARRALGLSGFQMSGGEGKSTSLNKSSHAVPPRLGTNGSDRRG